MSAVLNGSIASGGINLLVGNATLATPETVEVPRPLEDVRFIVPRFRFTEEPWSNIN